MAILAVVSDLHGNHPAGLMPAEGVTLQNGNHVAPNIIQRWSWDRWMAFRDAVGEALEHDGGPLHVVVNGEICDGHHHGSTEFISASKSIMRDIGRAILRPLMELKPATLHVLRGTEVHAGAEGADDDEIAKALDAERDPATGAASFYHLRADFAGTRVDIKHHGRGASLPWTAGGNANRLAAQLIHDYYDDPPEQRPHLALRAHVHRYADSYHLHPIRAIFSDAWQLNTVYGHRIDGGSSLRPVGGLIVYCDGAPRPRVERLHWTAPRAPMLTYGGQ